MPPHEDCPNCQQKVQDWHIEWYKTEAVTVIKGLAAMDCPLCGQPVGCQRGLIGPAPPGVPLVRRHVDQAAEWAAWQATAVGGTLQGYLTTAGPGVQYANYFCPQEVLRADADVRARKRGREMSMLTPEEKAFLDVFLHEATTTPFTGPATRALHAIGLGYTDISYLSWAYNRKYPNTGLGWGQAAEAAPPLPWTDRDAALRRNQQIKRLWEQQRRPAGAPKTA
jgi:hypothetical protein